MQGQNTLHEKQTNQNYGTNNILCCFVDHLDRGLSYLPAVPGVPRKSEDIQNYHFYPLDRGRSNLPDVLVYRNANCSTGTSSPGSANTDYILGRSSQESEACTVQRPSQIMDESNVRRDLQFPSPVDEPHSYDTANSDSRNNSVPMDFEVYEHSAISGQAICHNGTSRNILEVDDSQDDCKSEICIDGSSYNRSGHFHISGISSDNASASSTDYMLPPPAEVQQSRQFRLGLLGGSTSVQHQQYQQQRRDTTFTEYARRQAVHRQRNENDDLFRILGHVRSPDYADFIIRLDTFLQWPSDTAQTPDQVAVAGFYYTGFQDIVRCFVCDGGLKNWDPDDDPWVEHARWFPHCAYVRHIKGEEFINLVRMATEESDEEDDYTVHRGATWTGAENSNTNTDPASNEITEPSVLENEDAQFVIEMGFSEKDVAMAINDILNKGKQDFTRQEIADIVLEKEMRGELSDSKLAANCPPSVGNTSATGQAMSENKHLKELLQCTQCKTKQRNVLFLPCTHHVVCESCSRDLHVCTCCYRKIKEKVRIYMS